jgi:hypothetical protein
VNIVGCENSKPLALYGYWLKGKFKIRKLMAKTTSL